MENKYTKQFDPRTIEPQWDAFEEPVQKLILPILVQAYQQEQQPRPEPIWPFGLADTINMAHRLRWGNMQVGEKRRNLDLEKRHK